LALTSPTIARTDQQNESIHKVSSISTGPNASSARESTGSKPSQVSELDILAQLEACRASAIGDIKPRCGWISR